MTVSLILLVFLAHFVGDFLVQTRAQAQSKSSDWNALAMHIATYSITLWMFLIIYLGITEHVFSGEALIYVFLNGALHFATDAVTSRITSYAHADYKNRQKLFWGTIGADQLLHHAALLVTLPLLG